jgi:molecular chaperone HtpG
VLSTDIPLNVSRSGLQADAAVKKISNYITRKVADKLKSLFTENREDFEKMERYQNRFRIRNAF